jgi:hypothetical protein
VAQFFQFLTKFQVVVDLAVEDNPGSAILIMDGLVTTFNINYREAAHTQPHAPFHVETIVIRTPMPDGGAHTRQQNLVNRFRVVSNYTYDSTHDWKKPYSMDSNKSSRQTIPSTSLMPTHLLPRNGRQIGRRTPTQLSKDPAFILVWGNY